MDVTQGPKVGQPLSDAKTQQPRPNVAAQQTSSHVDPTALADPTALTDLGRAAVDGLHIDVRSHLQQALRLDPTAVGPRVLLFLVELRGQAFAAAEELVIALLRDNPREPDYLAMYADLKLRTVDLPKARALCLQALDIEPEHVDALRVKVLLDIVSGQRSTVEHQAAERHTAELSLAQLIEQDPNSRQVYQTLFQTLIERRQFEEATRLGQELLRLEPDNAALATSLIELRVLFYPLGLPVYTLRKAGWLGLGMLVCVAVAGYKVLAVLAQSLGLAFFLTCLGVAAYSRLYPALLRR